LGLAPPLVVELGSGWLGGAGDNAAGYRGAARSISCASTL